MVGGEATPLYLWPQTLNLKMMSVMMTSSRANRHTGRLSDWLITQRS